VATSVARCKSSSARDGTSGAVQTAVGFADQIDHSPEEDMLMKVAIATVAGLGLVVLAVAPALAGGDQKSKTSDTQKVPAAGSTSVTAEPKTDASTSVNTGASTQTQGTVTTDSPSASPATPNPADNPSKPADAPSATPRDTSEESKDKK
jgi:hypothetical protein